MTVATPAGFDAELMLSYMDGIEEIARIMLSGLVKDFDERIQHLDSALASGALPKAQRAAHTLKGLAKGGGAPALAELAYAIETACNAGELTQASACLPEFKRLASQIKAEWQSYLAEDQT